jgi:hypothetical protein
MIINKIKMMIQKIYMKMNKKITNLIKFTNIKKIMMIIIININMKIININIYKIILMKKY